MFSKSLCSFSVKLLKRFSMQSILSGLVVSHSDFIKLSIIAITHQIVQYLQILHINSRAFLPKVKTINILIGLA